MDFKWLTTDEYQRWDAFVESSPQGSIFSKTNFLIAAGIDFKIGLAVSGGKIQGGIALPRGLLGLNTTPLWAKHHGPILRPIESGVARALSTTKEILEVLIDGIDGVSSFDYNFDPRFQYLLPFQWSGYRHEVRFTYRFSTIPSESSLLIAADGRVGNTVRKATKNGLRFVEDVSIEELYSLQEKTYRRQGTKPPQKLGSFFRTASSLKAAKMFLTVGAIDENDRVHAAAGILYDRNCSYLLFNGVNYDLTDLGGNSFLLFHFITRAHHFSKTFDFEGSSIKPIERFYRSFGAELSPYYRVYKPTIKTLGLRTMVSIGKTALGYRR